MIFKTLNKLRKIFSKDVEDKVIDVFNSESKQHSKEILADTVYRDRQSSNLSEDLVLIVQEEVELYTQDKLVVADPHRLIDPEDLRASKNGVADIASHEGLCLTKYRDSVGVWTIGIGMTRAVIPTLDSWPLDRKITPEYAFSMFIDKLEIYAKAVRDALKRPIKQHEFDALVSWCYNVGPGWVRKGALLNLINNKYKKELVYNKFMEYSTPKSIIPRRRKEAILYTEGRYSNPSGTVLLYPVSQKYHTPIFREGIPVNIFDYIS